MFAVCLLWHCSAGGYCKCKRYPVLPITNQCTMWLGVVQTKILWLTWGFSWVMLHYSLKSSLGHKKIHTDNKCNYFDCKYDLQIFLSFLEITNKQKTKTKNSCSLFKFTSLLIDGRLKLDCNTLRSGGDENERNNDGSRVGPWSLGACVQLGLSKYVHQVILQSLDLKGWKAITWWNWRTCPWLGYSL